MIDYNVKFEYSKEDTKQIFYHIPRKMAAIKTGLTMVSVLETLNIFYIKESYYKGRAIKPYKEITKTYYIGKVIKLAKAFKKSPKENHKQLYDIDKEFFVLQDSGSIFPLMENNFVYNKSGKKIWPKNKRESR